jgi:hypothetical protein
MLGSMVWVAKFLEIKLEDSAEYLEYDDSTPLSF